VTLFFSWGRPDLIARAQPHCAADRFWFASALPHAAIQGNANKPIFYAQWLIKPSTWKALRKMMVKVRAENRSVKDPLKAFTLAVEREMAARSPANLDRH